MKQLEKEKLANGGKNVDGSEKTVIVPNGHMSFDDQKTIINQDGWQSSNPSFPSGFGHMNF